MHFTLQNASKEIMSPVKPLYESSRTTSLESDWGQVESVKESDYMCFFQEVEETKGWSLFSIIWAAMDARLRVKLDRIYPKSNLTTTVSLICRNYCDSDPNRHFRLKSICLSKVTLELVCIKLDWRQPGLGINKCLRQKYLMSLMS